MRKLNTGDLFSAVRFINKLGLKDTFKHNLKEKEGKDAQELGFDLIFDILTTLANDNSESAFYEFISRPLECSKEEVETMELTVLVESILHIASYEEWQGFLQKVMKSTSLQRMNCCLESTI